MWTDHSEIVSKMVDNLCIMFVIKRFRNFIKHKWEILVIEIDKTDFKVFNNL